MEKTYRVIVLAGLLVGLIVNGVATYRLKADVADMHTGIVQVVSDIDASLQSIKAGLYDVENDLDQQIAEHERLIMDLERRVNIQLDS